VTGFCPWCRHVDAHSIDCVETAKTQPHAMINRDGEVFYPDNIADAIAFAQDHGAWPLDPIEFPFLTPEQALLAKVLPDNVETGRIHLKTAAGSTIMAEPARQMARVNFMSPAQQSAALIAVAALDAELFDRVTPADEDLPR
jgi:hypothetical protein